MRRISPKLASRASLETLEGRRLLSGNVTVTNDGVNLVIAGDNKSNQIEVKRDDINGGYVVTGQTGTLINGLNTPYVLSTGLGNYRNVDISMGNGEDDVTLAFAASSFNVNNLTIDTGNGKDTVTIPSLFSTGNVSVDTGNGADVVTRSGVQTIAGNLVLDGGNGPDVLDESGLILSAVGGTTTKLDFETLL